MQCEYITPNGRCKGPTRSKNEPFCPIHKAKESQADLNQYRINCALLGSSLQRHHAADQLKNMSAEVSIVRSLLEARLNMIQNDAELVAAMPVIKDFALTVDKLAQSCHTMDVKLGNLLNKKSLMKLAQAIITIIDASLRPLIDTTPTATSIDELIELVGEKLVEAVAAMENEPDG